MAEATTLVCDYCGRAAVDTLRFRVRNSNYLLDVCQRHLDDLKSRARKPRRGRPRKGAE
jgi:hypothetical protein